MKNINLSQIKIKDGFWSEKQELITEQVIPFQEKVLNDEIEGVEKSHAFANFRIAAGLEKGEFYGMVFQDSDVAKWLEGVAYSLTVKPNPELEKRVDEIIDTIAMAQQPDGYLNTYFTIKEPEHRWQNLQECHELYCAGHMMEAAAAYYETTGKDKLLKVMERMADHIGKQFGPGKRPGIPGHQEVEIGLMRLYHVTGKEKYKELAQYFIDERGKNPHFFEEESEKRGWKHFGIDPKDTKYNQSFAPVREQKTAEGHSVRAVYMYTAMADIAAQTGEKELTQACETLWNNITQKRMYLTGGIGSTMEGEAFSIDYDLPNDMAYAETCASIGLGFFARRMLDIHADNRYADIMERVLYNGVLSGIQLDGKKFFYVNPLEVNPGVSGEIFGYKHVLPQRPGWYACACCPPNLVRMVMSLGKYAWGESEDTVYSHLFVGGEAKLGLAQVEVESDYPWNGRVSYTVTPTERQRKFSFAIRIPAYVKDKKILLNGRALSDSAAEADAKSVVEKDGYLYFTGKWEKQEKIELRFELPVRKIYCNTAVRANENCVALMRGPVVYCFEGVDNDGLLQELRISDQTVFEASICQEGALKGMTVLTGKGEKLLETDVLYSENRADRQPVMLRAIPYFAWGNRGVNQMRVWMEEA